MHIKQLKLKKPVQQGIVASFEAATTKNMFYIDLCQALVGANIPFYKLKLPAFKTFIEKYTQRIIPDESTLRKNYLNIVYDTTISKIHHKIGEHYIYAMVDETTDSRGLYICNLLVGILHPEMDPTPMLISCKVLTSTNHETVSRFINDSLMDFYKNTEYQNKILLLVSDAAPYMIKTGHALKVFYRNMIHVTCLAHGLNRVLEKIREIFPHINKLVCNGKKIFLKSPSRVVKYKTIMQCELPPEPVLTRWGTWLNSALFYADNFQKFKTFINELGEDGSQSVVKMKNIVKSDTITSDLVFIKSHLSTLTKIITDLETRNLSLNAQIELVEKFKDNICKIDNDKGNILKTKIESVLNKNIGYSRLKVLNDCINGKTINNEEVNMEPHIIAAYKKCPITSVDVERSFSMLKNILSDRRHNFNEKNFEMYNIVHFYESLCNSD